MPLLSFGPVNRLVVDGLLSVVDVNEVADLLARSRLHL